MVVPSPTPARSVAAGALGIPSIDLSQRRDRVAKLIARACEEVGFFKVINHGVPTDAIARMEAAGFDFFSLPAHEKQKAGPPNPLGYGSRNIGFNGDTGELEYLLLHANNPSCSQKAKMINRKDPLKFSCVVNEYVEAVRQLACEILEMLGEGLRLRDCGALSRPIRDCDSDSLVRINHYPPCYCTNKKVEDELCTTTTTTTTTTNTVATATATATAIAAAAAAAAKSSSTMVMNNSSKHKISRVGFGEHSDPQIISILRSNGVDGLQVLQPAAAAAGGEAGGGGVWVPVAFFINVGDLLQAMTNGRLTSIRHRAMANSSYKSRLSIIFFGAPPLHSLISPLPEMITADSPRRYRPFTWAEYKKTMYSLRLSQDRLDLFRTDRNDELTDLADLD
ncbi:gibberellin 2-beta-dioxygenase 2-like [Ananas comosus]|uniref:Gibberellin 2-beta-dioxygenase 2-like n=1 Tax=Ananas comosus TaxID=4615 RepID=A0A6P5H0S4_ANACO|nr:gibberellin 2-beta-dioxygenase 2-like [Ananas comosus]